MKVRDSAAFKDYEFVYFFRFVLRHEWSYIPSFASIGNHGEGVEDSLVLLEFGWQGPTLGVG